MKNKILDHISWIILNFDDFMLMSSMFLFTIFTIGVLTYCLITNFIATLWVLAAVLGGLAVVGIVVVSLVVYIELKEKAYFWAVKRQDLKRREGK